MDCGDEAGVDEGEGGPSAEAGTKAWSSSIPPPIVRPALVDVLAPEGMGTGELRGWNCADALEVGGSEDGEVRANAFALGDGG